MNEILIQYQGFHPSDFTYSYLDAKLAELHKRAPQGATLRAVFTRKNKSFTANVRILSAAGQFFVSVRGNKMRDVTRKLEERLHKQLRRWKTLRFAGGPHDTSVA